MEERAHTGTLDAKRRRARDRGVGLGASDQRGAASHNARRPALPELVAGFDFASWISELVQIPWSDGSFRVLVMSACLY